MPCVAHYGDDVDAAALQKKADIIVVTPMNGDVVPDVEQHQLVVSNNGPSLSIVDSIAKLLDCVNVKHLGIDLDAWVATLHTTR